MKYILDAVPVGDAGDLIAPGEHRGPVVHVLRGIGNNHGLSRRAGGGLDAYDLLVRNRLDAPGIRVAQVGLVREGNLFKIFRAVHAGNPGFFVHLAVIVTAGQNPFDLLVHQGQLGIVDSHVIPLLSGFRTHARQV